MKLNFSKFKKVSQDKDTAVMRHDDGHEIKIALKSLSPKMRAELHALPIHEAKDIQKYSDGDQVGNPKDVQDFQKGATSSGFNPSQWAQNVKEGLSSPQPTPKPQKEFARGGKVADKAHYDEGTPQNPVSSDDASKSDSAAAPESQADQYFSNADSSQAPAPQASQPIINVNVGQPQQMPQGQPPMPQQAPPPVAAATPAPTPTPLTQQFGQANYGGTGLAGEPTPEQAVEQGLPQTQGEVGPPAQMPEPPQANPMDSYFKAASQGLNEQKNAADAMAAAKSAQGTEEAKAYNQSIPEQERLNDLTAARIRNNFQEHNNFMHDYENGHIDVNHLAHDQGIFGRIASTIGLILGGISSGVTHQGNPALDYINKQIDRDIDAQKANLGIKKNLLEANMQHYGNITDAATVLKTQLNGITSSMLGRAAANATGPAARAAALKDKGILDHQNAFLLSQVGAPKSGAAGGSQGNSVDNYLNMMRVVDPERAKELSTRYIPGVGIAPNPVPQPIRDVITERKLLGDNISQLMQFAKQHGGTLGGVLSPSIKAQGEALAKQVQDQYRRANQQGVFKPAEAEFVNNVIADQPSSLFAKITKVPAYGVAQQINQHNLDEILHSVGIQGHAAGAAATSGSSSNGFKPKSFKPAR